MDELVALVSKKSGLSTDQSKMVVKTVLDYLKKKLPAPIAGEIDGVLSGKGGVQDMLGGLMGGKK